MEILKEVLSVTKNISVSDDSEECNLETVYKMSA